MKKIFASISIIIVAMTSATAQSMQTTYFLDNNMYSYRINPAIASEKGFVGIFLNNLNFTVGSSNGVNSLIYHTPNGLVTGFNSAVTPQEFLDNLKDRNRFNIEENISLLSIGIWTKHDFFNNIEVNVRGYQNAGIPKDLFGMLKSGSGAYDLSRTSVNVQSYLEVAYGLSKKINDKVSFGFRLKFLAGLENLNVSATNANFSIEAQSLSCTSDLTLRCAANMLKIPTKPSVQVPSRMVLDYGHIGFNRDLTPSGYGGAADLGITVKPVDELSISLAVLDLGAVNWTYNVVGLNQGGGLNCVEMSDISDGAIPDEMKAAWERLQKYVEFIPREAGQKSLELMPINVNLGVRYRLPAYERLSFGALGTYRINKYLRFWEIRAGATITPIDWLSITGNYGCNDNGLTYGAAVSLNLATINFALGWEGYSGKSGRYVTKNNHALSLPHSGFRYNLNLGITITMGQRHRDYAVKKKLWATGK